MKTWTMTMIKDTLKDSLANQTPLDIDQLAQESGISKDKIMYVIEKCVSLKDGIFSEEDFDYWVVKQAEYHINGLFAGTVEV